MPAKDKYHDTVKRALERAGWTITSEQVTLVLENRYVYVDIQIQRDETDIVLVEVKTFDDTESPIALLQQAIGQYIIYRSVLAYLQIDIPLYLSVPLTVYRSFFQEQLSKVVIETNKINLVIIDIENEEVIEWIAW